MCAFLSTRAPMAASGEPLLPPAGNIGQGRGIACKQYVSIICVVSTGLLLTRSASGFLCGSVSSQYFVRNVHFIYDEQHSGRLLKTLGVVLYVQHVLCRGIAHMRTLPQSVGVLKITGMPCPALIACIVLVCSSLGSILLLSRVPVLMRWGGEFVIMFLLGVKCVGHLSPLANGRTQAAGTAPDDMNDLSLIGTSVMIIAYEIPDGLLKFWGFPTAVEGVPGFMYSYISTYAWLIKLVGTLLFVMPFLCAGVKLAIGYAQIQDMRWSFGYIVFFNGGASLMLTQRPFLMRLGAYLLIILLMSTTCIMHLRFWMLTSKQQKPDFVHMSFKLALLGTCLMIVGYETPALRTSAQVGHPWFV